MAEAVNPEKIVEAVAVVDLKAIGEAGAIQQNIATANSVAHQQAMFSIQQAATGKIVESIIATSPGEGGIDTANLAQLAKIAGTTPPVTV